MAHLPELDGTETVAVEQGETHGDRSLEFGKGKKGDALIVAVRCQGEGAINVAVRAMVHDRRSRRGGSRGNP